MLTLGVASWDFGAVRGWATTRFGRSTRWTTPLLVSMVTGVALGAASPALIGQDHGVRRIVGALP